jgi:hypothetical protein
VHLLSVVVEVLEELDEDLVQSSEVPAQALIFSQSDTSADFPQATAPIARKAAKQTRIVFMK